MADDVRIKVLVKSYLIRTNGAGKALLADDVRIKVLVKSHLIRTNGQ
ncbi:MAG: hypothetical protein IJJ65_02075 [Butyrivibrio sp.]|nr:hypothetical protein [Butyrivibrio sp.]